MHIETDHRRPGITFAEMKKFLVTGWGEVGARIADAWAGFNHDHFAGKLSPLPIVLTATSPFGRWTGFTHCNPRRRRADLIELTWPRAASTLKAGRGTLLHEMIHQHLAERGRDPGHDGEDWCAEIMRVHRELTNQRIWAAPQVIGKLPARKDPMGRGERRSVRVQKPDPETGKPSLSRRAIAGWPPPALSEKLGPL